MELGQTIARRPPGTRFVAAAKPRPTSAAGGQCIVTLVALLGRAVLKSSVRREPTRESNRAFHRPRRQCHANDKPTGHRGDLALREEPPRYYGFPTYGPPTGSEDSSARRRMRLRVAFLERCGRRPGPGRPSPTATPAAMIAEEGGNFTSPHDWRCLAAKPCARILANFYDPTTAVPRLDHMTRGAAFDLRDPTRRRHLRQAQGCPRSWHPDSGSGGPGSHGRQALFYGDYFASPSKTVRRRMTLAAANQQKLDGTSRRESAMSAFLQGWCRRRTVAAVSPTNRPHLFPTQTPTNSGHGRHAGHLVDVTYRAVGHLGCSPNFRRAAVAALRARAGTAAGAGGSCAKHANGASRCLTNL